LQERVLSRARVVLLVKKTWGENFQRWLRRKGSLRSGGSWEMFISCYLKRTAILIPERKEKGESDEKRGGEKGLLMRKICHEDDCLKGEVNGPRDGGEGKAWPPSFVREEQTRIEAGPDVQEKKNMVGKEKREKNLLRRAKRRVDFRYPEIRDPTLISCSRESEDVETRQGNSTWERRMI